MNNPEMVAIPEVQNAWNLIFTFVAAALLVFVIVRAVSAYKDEDERRAWKAILWGVPTVIVVWRVMDVINFILELWNRI